jgi:hypothetical protein
MPTPDLNKLHIETTYAVQAQVDRVWVDPTVLLELIDAYQLQEGSPLFVAFKAAVERARKAEVALADLRAGNGADGLLTGGVAP